MSNWKRLVLSFLLISSSVYFGCKPPVISEENYQSEIGDRVIAVADSNYTLTVSQVFESMQSTKLMPRGGTVPAEKAAEILDSILMDTLSGFKADEDVDLLDHKHQHWTYRLRYHDYLLRVWVREAIYSQIEIDSQIVEDFRQEHPEMFEIEEQVFLSHIMVSPRWFRLHEDSARYNAMSQEEFEQEIKAYTDNVYQKLLDGADFHMTAQNFSHDKLSRDDGGMVGWTKRNVYIYPFDSIAFSLDVGQFSAPYHDRDGWHIVHVSDHLPAGLPPLDRPEYREAARRGYLSYHVNQMTDAILDSLRQDMDLVFNEPWLDSNVFNAPEFLWGGIVNGMDTVDMKLMRNLEMQYRRDNRVSVVTGELKKNLIRELANRFLVIQEARKYQMDTLPDVLEEEYRLRHETTRMLTLVSRFRPDWRPEDTTIERYYNEHISEYVSDKPLTIQVLWVPDSLIAEFLRDQALSGIEMADLAGSYDLDDGEIKANYKNIGAIGEADVDSATWEVAHDTPEGDVSLPHKVGDNWQIVKVVDRIRNMRLPQARGGIVSVLSDQYEREEIRNYTQRLLERYNVKFIGKLPPFHLKPLNLRPDQQGS